MAELHETGYGRTLLERDMPGIRKALERIATALELIAVNENNNIIEETMESYDDRYKFMMSQKAYEGKLTRILNTISNSTAEDLADVIAAIKKSEIKWEQE